MRTDLVPLPCLDCYMVHQPTALDTWVQHWMPVIVELTTAGAVVFVAVFVVLWRMRWLRASRQEPQAGDRAVTEEVRTGSERAGGNSDAGS